MYSSVTLIAEDDPKTGEMIVKEEKKDAPKEYQQVLDNIRPDFLPPGEEPETPG